jgi:hypothetical protein
VDQSKWPGADRRLPASQSIIILVNVSGDSAARGEGVAAEMATLDASMATGASGSTLGGSHHPTGATQQQKHDQVRRVLGRRAALHVTEPSEGLFRFQLERVECLIRVRDQTVVLYALWDERVPVASRDDVSLYCVRVNFGLNFGNFEMNYADGQVRYKLSIQAAQVMDITVPLDSLLDLAPTVFRRWVSGIAQVCEGASPEDAYLACKAAGGTSSQGGASTSGTAIRAAAPITSGSPPTNGAAASGQGDQGASSGDARRREIAMLQDLLRGMDRR